MAKIEIPCLTKTEACPIISVQTGVILSKQPGGMRNPAGKGAPLDGSPTTVSLTTGHPEQLAEQPVFFFLVLFRCWFTSLYNRPSCVV